MSQIEQAFRVLLSAEPDIEKSYRKGLINRRALARYLIRRRIASKGQMDAVIAMLRRHEFGDESGIQKQLLDLFEDARVILKDNICVLDFKKDKLLLQKLQRIIALTEYDRGDTLKIVVGTASIKLFIDKRKLGQVKELLDEHIHLSKLKYFSEISIMFHGDINRIKGILSIITREFAMNDIVIEEFLTATPELLIYIDEKYVLSGYNIIKRLQKQNI